MFVHSTKISCVLICCSQLCNLWVTSLYEKIFTCNIKHKLKNLESILWTSPTTNQRFVVYGLQCALRKMKAMIHLSNINSNRKGWWIRVCWDYIQLIAWTVGFIERIVESFAQSRIWSRGILAPIRFADVPKKTAKLQCVLTKMTEFYALFCFISQRVRAANVKNHTSIENV